MFGLTLESRVLKQKLLGAAFAACDLIFEVDHEGLITFALGSTQGLVASENGSLEGQCWRNLFSVDDQYLLAALLRGLQSGERKGPLAVTLAPEAHDAVGRPAMLSVFRLPSRDGDPMSCALTFHGMSGWSDGASVGRIQAVDLHQVHTQGQPGGLRLVHQSSRGLGESFLVQQTLAGAVAPAGHAVEG